jgi:hypothetical protein
MAFSTTILMAKAVLFTGYYMYSGISYVFSNGDTSDPAIKRLTQHTITLETQQLEMQNIILELKKKLENKFDLVDVEYIPLEDTSEPDYYMVEMDPDYDFLL